MTEPAPRRPGSGLGAVVALCRASNLPTVWMNVLAGVALAGGVMEPAMLVPVLVSMSALYAFGMAFNDLCDRDHDALHQPFRPIPSQRISVAGARVVAGSLAAIGLVVLAVGTRPEALMAGGVLVALICAYDWLHKRHPATVLLMAACRAAVFGVAALAATGEATPLVGLGAGVAFAYTLLVTVVARHEDVRGSPYGFPLIPRMIAAMPLVDAGLLAVVASPAWLVVGGIAALLTHLGQRVVRGD